MEGNPGTVAGGCMCGSVRYEAIGEPLEVGYCHCHSCRRHTGAPVVALVFFEADKVRFTRRERSIYNSSPGVKRGFCDQCGTSLTWEGKYGGRAVINIHISTFDDPDAHVPGSRFFMKSGLPGSTSPTVRRDSAAKATVEQAEG